MHEPSSRPFARREHNNVVGRKTVSVEGHWDFEQAVKFRQSTETGKPRLYTSLFLRCAGEWLTMCKVVVIIKRFRELSLACLRTAVLLDAQPALATGSGENLG
jgi:hypothetical protein